jgi:hypothetical protein
VVLCCDPGWPERDVALFNRVFEAAVASGWRPTAEESEEGAGPRGARRVGPEAAGVEEAGPPAVAEAVPSAPIEPPRAGSRLFGGAAYCGDMRDPREGSWLALLELFEERLRLVRLEATGRTGLHGRLRDPDGTLMRAEGIGLAFPFGLPLPFAERLLGGTFPEEGWWALARHLEKTSLPDYLVALHDFRGANGEVARLTDEAVGAPSPLTRTGPDPGSMAYHGIKMIAEERSRYAIRPFERAQGKVLVEVYPAAVLRKLPGVDGARNGVSRRAVLPALAREDRWPVEVPPALAAKCLARAEALEAVVAARSAALAVLTGEADRTPDDLAPGQGDRVRREGWIYGLTP